MAQSKNFSDKPLDDHIELRCPQCGHPFEVDLAEWQMSSIEVDPDVRAALIAAKRYLKRREKEGW